MLTHDMHVSLLCCICLKFIAKLLIFSGSCTLTVMENWLEKFYLVIFLLLEVYLYCVFRTESLSY
jgi:hypothetical protein